MGIGNGYTEVFSLACYLSLSSAYVKDKLFFLQFCVLNDCMFCGILLGLLLKLVLKEDDN